MLALAVAKDVDCVMKKHVYKFAGEVFKQNEGGAIGYELTGVVAKTRMIFLLRKLKEVANGLELAPKIADAFVDDVMCASKKIPAGWRYDCIDKRLVWKVDDQEEDLRYSPDEITARLMVSVANSLEPDIQFTYDAPSCNSDNKMPVLDLKIWCQDNKILFRFFEKSMAADRTIMRDSALSWMTKKVSLSNEICRQLLNTSPELILTGEAELDIEQFCYKMYLSGYSEKERMIIEREGRNQYKNIVKMSDIGCRPMYRGSDWCKQERAVSKLRSRKEWYGKKNDAVIFAQATPEEVLQREIQKVVNSSGLRLKVVERGGKSLKGVFQRSDVMPDSRCWKDDCVVYSTKPKGLCSKEGVGYRIWCEVCDREGTEAVRHGETGRCARVRCGEHIAA